MCVFVCRERRQRERADTVLVRGDYMDFSDVYCKAEKNTEDTSK